MGDYVDLKSGAEVDVKADKFAFPNTGARLLLKKRPPIAKEVKTDW